MVPPVHNIQAFGLITMKIKQNQQKNKQAKNTRKRKGEPSHILFLIWELVFLLTPDNSLSKHPALQANASLGLFSSHHVLGWDLKRDLSLYYGIPP